MHVETNTSIVLGIMAGLCAFNVRIIAAFVMGGSRGEAGSPKNHKNIGFPRSTGLDPLTKSQSYQPAFNVGPL